MNFDMNLIKTGQEKILLFDIYHSAYIRASILNI